MSHSIEEKSPLKIRVVGSNVELNLGGKPEEKHVFAALDVPDLVRQLLERGRLHSARAVADAWWVAIANEHGFTNYSLGDD